MPEKVFLLSPANLSGLRAKQLMSSRAQFDAAVMYRSPEGVPIGLAFAFMSALYFRGKITYALHFADPSNVYVIAPGFGPVSYTHLTLPRSTTRAPAGRDLPSTFASRSSGFR